MSKHSNQLHLVTKRRTSLTGVYHDDVQGFDYKDEETGLTLNVRGTPNNKTIRVCDKLISVAELRKLVGASPK